MSSLMPNKMGDAGERTRPLYATNGHSPSARVRDEQMNDLLAREAASSLVAACGGSAQIADLVGVTERHARRWGAGCRSNPLHRVGETIRKSKHRWAIVRHFIALAVLGDLEEAGALTEWRVKQLWADADREDVQSETADINQRVLFDYDGDLAHLYEADARVLGPALRRMALTLLCRRRSWDPRPMPKAAR